MTNKINIKEIEQAQGNWGAAIADIGRAFTAGENYGRITGQYLDTLYAFDRGPVLFKPTKAAIIQFRPSRESALSYFIGGNDDFPEDHGFALEPWLNVRFENNQTYLHGDYAVAMGNYYFTGKDGKETKVEYTFGYQKDEEGNLRINLHHSSLPFPTP